MCAIAPILGGLLLGGAMYSSAKQSKKAAAASQQTPQYETYTPQAAADFNATPEIPTASPVMTTQGQGSAEDQQNATEQQVKRNRQGRNVFRIDRTVPTGGSTLGGGSGVNVPT